MMCGLPPNTNHQQTSATTNHQLPANKIVAAGACWLLLAAAGGCWRLLVAACCCWRLLAAAGGCRCLRVAVGGCWWSGGG
eukprot:799258-Lingulodinium_polyedra.AAC.1